MIGNTFRTLLLAVLAMHLVLASPLYAYLDLGTGSYLFQLGIAFLVGAAFSIKLLWHRIKKWFAATFRGRSDEHGDDTDRP